MPYATRQGIINFPKKKKAVLQTSSKKIEDDVKRTPESKVLISSTSASSSARKAFHGSASDGIVGREKELKQLTDFVMSHLENQTSGSIYISGLPGTGKTASVNYMIEKNELSKKCQILKINCTAFNSSKAIFTRLCEMLKLKTIKTEKDAIFTLEKYLLRKHKIILLILDEIDQLETKSQSVLYKLFEWPSLENSKFLLIGIANAIDLTDRQLPRLCAKVELKPILIHFAPYTKEQIVDILKNRLHEAEVDKIFAPGAVELIAAKVAGTSGDVRRALDLGKRVIEISESKHRLQGLQGNQVTQEEAKETNASPRKVLKRKMEEISGWKTPSKLDRLMSELDNELMTSKADVNGSSPEITSPKQFKNCETSSRVCLHKLSPHELNCISGSSPLRRSPRKVSSIDGKQYKENSLLCSTSPEKRSLATIKEEEGVLRKSPRKLHFDVDSKDVLSVVKNVFGSSKNFKPNEESSFPLHQKLLICTLLLIMKKGKKKDLNIGKLHQVYSKICTKRGLTAVDRSGFLFLCRQVETTGVLQIGKGVGTLAKVSLLWDDSEITDSIKDLNMLSSILNDTACLS